MAYPLVDIDFIERVYTTLTPIYDLVFGPILQPGRVEAVRRMRLKPGDLVLEVGVGTGINASLYPRSCRVVGIDVSESMLEKARARIREERLNVHVQRMDAAHMGFADATFDAVYAPYTISVVPDPVAVVNEMCRVCRPGGTIILLNHFGDRQPVARKIERLLTPFTTHLGFRLDLDLGRLLDATGLAPHAIDAVNVPPLWTLVEARKV
jgi:phosphatidylethanolamine/phosphatidyl-N-methylethanolamine N-methyltransferase